MAMDLVQLFGQLDGRVSRLAWILASLTLLMPIVNAFHTYIRLRYIPGPPLAALTNLVRRSWVTTGDTPPQIALVSPARN